jgi:hypothetical protein
MGVFPARREPPEFRGLAGGSCLAGAAGCLAGADRAVPVEAYGGGVVLEVPVGDVEQVTGEFLDYLAGMAVRGGGEEGFDVDASCVAFEVTVGDDQQPVAVFEGCVVGAVGRRGDAEGLLRGQVEGKIRPSRTKKGNGWPALTTSV